MRKRLTQIVPFLLPIRVKQRALLYRIKHKMDKNKYSKEINDKILPKSIYKHKSLLLRKLGDTDMQLQINKVVNLKLAASHINHILIKPGETFSFWDLVGEISKRKGYKEGALLSDGLVKKGLGGGLCQLANLLFWLFLHTPLDIVERYRHGFDPFPDYGRVIPFGTGATLVYGWIDLKMKNNTPYTFQILIDFDDEYIYGEIKADNYPEYKYHIREENHYFIRKTDGIHRCNEIYCDYINRKTGLVEESKLLFKNDCIVKYELDDSIQIKE